MKNDQYPLFLHWYKTLDWILDRCESLPKNARFSIAARLADYALDTLEQITEAIYRKDKAPLLHQINLNLEKLRILFRLCHDRRYISVQQYGYISGLINEAGRMTGGWLKSLSKPGNPPA
ncbi:MAG: diversity-generating retroelement protein Avd [Bacteroidia bacterium]|nr:diversity-generating retroelement protein Avd [Bacteroidia bacterium]